MISVKPKITWKTAILPALGIAAFIIYLYVFQADMPEILATIKRANFPLFFSAAILVFIDTFFYAMAWRVLLNHLSVNLSILKSYLYVWYGTFMDIIIPAESISGEISRIYLVTREQGNMVSGKVVASLIAHRLISMGVCAATIVVGMSMLLAEKYGRVDSLIFNLSLFLAIAITFFLALLLILCFKREWTLKIIDFGIGAIEFLSRKRWKLKKVREEAVKVAGMFHNSMEEFGRAPKVVVVSIFLSSLSWLFYLGISYMVFLALDFPIVWSVVLVTQSIVSAVKSIPMGVPFEVGLPEITMTTIYKVLGVPFGLSATATILTRILTVWLRFFIGFVAQQWLEIKTITAALSEGAEGKPKSSTAYISGENGNRKNHD
ncbi:MAG: lysylphosphatidylglycerol synthase transmembrane domain-containing protein [Candidatus Bathyarchaeia archaeon]